TGEPWRRSTNCSAAWRCAGATNATSTATTTRRTSWRRVWTSASDDGLLREESDVRRIVFLTIGLGLLAPVAARAGTFERTRIAPEFGLDALTRGVARERVGRDLFANPYATVTIGHVDLYATFPYVESRTFQIVSDPRWNRLVFGESGRTLRAYDGKGSALGALSEPRGL